MEHTYYSVETLDRNRREPRRNYMTLQQRLEVIADTNEIALFLLEFYYSKTGSRYDYTDKQVAKAISWTEKKVAENRRKLEKAGYFKKEITKNSKSSTLNILLGHQRWNSK